MKQISSKSNPYIKSIRQLKNKRYRDETGTYYLEGLRLVGEALQKNAHLECILYCPELLVSEFGMQAVHLAEDKGVELIEVTDEVFQTFSLKDGPQGLAAIGKQKWTSLDELSNPKGLWIALDSIQDPGNLGTILRSLDGAGGTGVILIGDATDAYHPTAARSSTGALFSLNICKCSEKDLIEWKGTITFPFIGTVCENGIPYRQSAYFDDMLLIMGSEQKGLQQEIAEICDELVTIPMAGSVDSLNLACAAAIVLFEIFDKRNKK